MRLRDKILFVVIVVTAVAAAAVASIAKTTDTEIQGKWFVHSACRWDVDFMSRSRDVPYPIDEIQNWCWMFQGNNFEWNDAPYGKGGDKSTHGIFQISGKRFDEKWNRIDLKYENGIYRYRIAYGIYKIKKLKNGNQELVIKFKSDPGGMERPVDFELDKDQGCTTVFLLREKFHD